MKQDKDTEYQAALEEVKTFQDADRDMRDLMREQDSFVLDADGQWEENVAKSIDSAKRPRYTFDQTTPAIENIMADIEDMDFAINVKPMADKATKDLAELREGMVRTIENMSSATEIYRSAARRIVRRGFDAWVVKNKYLNDWAFEQDLCIEPIPNAVNRVWTSPTSTRPDNSDSEVTYIYSALSPKDYKEMFPDGSGISLADAETYDTYNDEYAPEVILIAERYYKKDKSIKIAKMSNGEVYEVDDKFIAIQDELATKGVRVVKEKTIKEPRFCHRVMDGAGWLGEEKETAFKTNPVVTVYGNFEILGQSNKRICSGITLKMMDYNRVLNYAKSREIEEGALAPRKKLMMTKKQAAGHTDQLSKMNVSSDPIQFYNPDPEAGTVPYETGGPQVNQNLNLLSNDMSMGLQITAGTNNAMNGQYAGRMSEDALRMQIDRGTGATRKWVNALATGIKRTGAIILDALPIVYDTKRQFSITGIDGTESDILINDEIYDEQTQQMVSMNNLNQGKYMAFCDVGPAFANKMEAGLEAMLKYAALDPAIVQQGGDIMLKAIDAPLVDIIAKRKRAMMLQQGLIPFKEMTDEEKQEAQQAAQQPREPAPDMLFAQAEMKKAEVDQMEAQIKHMSAQIKAFEAETKRQKVLVDAEVAGANIENKQVDTFGKKIDNQVKMFTPIN